MRHMQCPLRANSGHRLPSLDHLVSGQKNAIRYGDAKCFGGFEIDYKLKFCGLLDWQFGWFCAFQNSRHIIRSSTPQWREIDAIRHQPTINDVMPEGEHSRQAMFNRELC